MVWVSFKPAAYLVQTSPLWVAFWLRGRTPTPNPHQEPVGIFRPRPRDPADDHLHGDVLTTWTVCRASLCTYVALFCALAGGLWAQALLMPSQGWRGGRPPPEASAVRGDGGCSPGQAPAEPPAQCSPRDCAPVRRGCGGRGLGGSGEVRTPCPDLISGPGGLTPAFSGRACLLRQPF